MLSQAPAPSFSSLSTSTRTTRLHLSYVDDLARRGTRTRSKPGVFGFRYKDFANPVAYGSDYELPDDLRIDPRETLLSGLPDSMQTLNAR